MKLYYVQGTSDDNTTVKRWFGSNKAAEAFRRSRGWFSNPQIEAEAPKIIEIDIRPTRIGIVNLLNHFAGNA